MATIQDGYDQFRNLYAKNQPTYRLSRESTNVRGGPRVDKYMKDLIPIIGSNSKRDIRYKPELSSIKAARHWIESKGAKDVANGVEEGRRFHDRYEAVEYDIDNDRINDVVVRAKNDPSNIKYINGYSLKPSKQHKRRAYYDAFPTRESRKEMSMSKYFDKEEAWNNEEISGKKSPYQKFIRYIISPLYDLICEKYTLKLKSGKNINFKTQCGAFIWSDHILPLLLFEYLGGDDKADEDVNWLYEDGLDRNEAKVRKTALEKIKKQEAFKQRCEDFIYTIRDKTRMKDTNKLATAILDIIADKLYELTTYDNWEQKMRDDDKLHENYGEENADVGLDGETISQFLGSVDDQRELSRSIRNPTRDDFTRSMAFTPRFNRRGGSQDSLHMTDLDTTEIVLSEDDA